MNTNEKDSASMSCEQYAATTSSYHLDKRMRLQNIMTLHVRWPDKRAVRRRRMSLIFLILFASRQKVRQTSLGKQKKRKELKKNLYWLD